MIKSEKVFILAVFSMFLFSLSQAQISPPEQEKVLQFRTNQVLIAPDVPELELGNEFTMQAWIFPQAYSPCNIIARSVDAECDISYALRLGEAGTKIELIQCQGGWDTFTSIITEDSIVLNEWTHVAATLKDGLLSLYVNGELYGTASSPGTPVNGAIPISIGNGLSPDVFPNWSCLKGAICQISIWNEALTEAEITAFAQNHLSGTESGLIAYWKCDQISDNIVEDFTDYNNDLTMFSNNEHMITYPILVRKAVIESGPYFSIKEFEQDNPEPGIGDGRFFDFENDGDLDFFGTQFKWPPDSAKLILLVNDGDLNFVERNDLILGRDFKQTMHPRHILTNDYNNDGLQDIFIADHGRDDGPATGGNSMLILQCEDGVMQPYIDDKIPYKFAFTHYATDGDIDLDGDEDIFMCNVSGNCYLNPEFYVNNGEASFNDSYEMIPEFLYSQEKKFTSTLLFDFDRDGDLDLYLGGHGGVIFPMEGFLNDMILINDGSGNFTEGSVTMPDRIGGLYSGTVAVQSDDFNNDGWPDIVISVNSSNYSQGWVQMFLNNQDGTFIDVTSQITQPFSIWDGTWIYSFFITDLNNDNWLDIVCNNSAMESLIWMNSGNAIFESYQELIPPHNSWMFNLCGIEMFPRDLNNDLKTDILFTVQNTSYYTGECVKLLELETPIVELPAKPNIIYPKDSVFTVYNPILQWNNAEVSQKVQIQIAQDYEFTDLIYDNSEITAISNWSVGLSPEDTLCWRVRAKNYAGFGEWSDVQVFITGNASNVNSSMMSDILVYPNPNSGNFTIDINNQIPSSAELYNSLGQIIWRNDCKEIENNLNINGIQPGNYILNLVIKEKCHRIKIVVL